MRRIQFLTKRLFCTLSEKEIILKFKNNYDSFLYNRSKLEIDCSRLVSYSHDEKIVQRITDAFFKNPNDFHIFKYPEIQPKEKDYNTPQNSFLRICLPLKTNEELRLKFIRFYSDFIRTGRILELLDYLASEASYKYCYTDHNEKKQNLVTICVDNMKFFGNLSAMKNLIIDAYPTYTGNSTIEIRIDLYQQSEEDLENNTNDSKEKKEIFKNLDLKATAQYLMAARNVNDHSKSVKVPALKIEGEKVLESRYRLEMGKINNIRRKKLASSSLMKSPPTAEEATEIYRIHQKRLSETEGIHYVTIGNTKLEKTLLMHLQDKNLHGKIFGGFIMREAFEIGWLSAFSFSKGLHPSIYHIDDVIFVSPVEIVKENLVSVTVDVCKVDPSNNSEKKATEVHLTFTIESTKALLPVYPETFQEDMCYLEAKRRLSDTFVNFKEYLNIS